MHARSLDPLVKTRVFGMTPFGDWGHFRKLHHYRFITFCAKLCGLC